MAITPVGELGPNIIGASGSFPGGSSKDETAPGNKDGTPYLQIRANDIFGFQQALTKMAGIVANGNADTALDKNSSQYLQAVLHAVLGANTFDESGVADVYVLDVVGDNPAPANYSSNMNVVFIPGNTNTGASTIDVEGLGVKDIRLGGVALVGAEIVAGVRTTLVYDKVNGWFELITTTGKLVQSVNDVLNTVQTGVLLIPNDDSKPQNGEGDQYLTVNITPRAITNKLKIEVLLNISHSSTLSVMAAGLFQDAIVAAIGAGAFVMGDDAKIHQIKIVHHMIAGVVVPITFDVRAGSNLAGTTTINGAGGLREYGGALESSITVTEESP